MPEPSYPPALASPPPASAARDGLLRLHAARRPWAFAPAALSWLEAHPDDHHARGLLITQFLQLGLPTPAREHAARIPAAGAAPLLHAAASIPHDQVPIETRLDTLTANLAAARNGTLGEFPPDVAEQALVFVRGTGSEQWLRCADGTVVVRPASGSDERPFTLFDDAAGWARSLPLPPGAAVVYLDGLLHPAVLRRVVAACPGSDDGFLPRIVIVEPSIERFARALASQPLHDLLSRPRFEWFIGPRALNDLTASLAARGGLAISGPVLPGAPPTGAPVRSAVAAAVNAACQAQEHEVNRLAAALGSADRVRDAAWWAARYTQALSGKGEPLRVLLSTTRYSTFVQHSTRDLAAALEAAGCRTHLLIEPDAASRSTNVAAGRAVTTFNPDLIVCINYHRTNLGAMAPPDVPYVCWVQDAMPHLFTPEAGRGLGAADFVVGHLHGEFFTRFGYPAARALALPVLVSAAKFHAGPCMGEGLSRYDCQVAAMTNQSETPERLLARVLHANAARPAVARVVNELYPVVERIVNASATQPCMDPLRAAAEHALRVCTGTADPGTLATIINQITLPLADRMLRHRALSWAAEICTRRGWRMHLYGQGWHTHPTLGAFACGSVAHGEHLRAAYQRAGCCLHASVNWNLHQRVLECALAGGLPLTLRKHDDLVLLEWLASRSISLQTDGWVSDPRTHATWGCAADHAHAMMQAAQLQRLGRACDGRIRWDRDHWLAHGTHGWGGALHAEAIWLMGDLCETSFGTAAELERVLETAVERPTRRASLASGIRRRVSAHLTYEQATRRMLAFIASSLACATTSDTPRASSGPGPAVDTPSRPAHTAV